MYTINYIFSPSVIYFTFINSEYGIIDLLNTLVSLLVPIVTLQIEQGIFRDLIEVRGNKEKETKIISTGLIVVSYRC